MNCETFARRILVSNASVWTVGQISPGLSPGRGLIADAFYLVENDVDLENVDVATNATTVATAFTRYTVAPTTAFSQSTRMTG